MSESSEIIRRLVEGGANYESIGQAVGRNRSLIRQVGIGSKPGNNLAESLAELERRLGSVPKPERNQAARSAPTTTRPTARTTRRGGLAKVRKPTTVGGERWSSSVVKRNAVQHGARGLGHPLADAADAGREIGVTVTVDKGLTVEAGSAKAGKRSKGISGPGGSCDFMLGDAFEVWDTISSEYDGNVTAYVADRMVDEGLVSGGARTGAEAASHIREIELRAF